MSRAGDEGTYVHFERNMPKWFAFKGSSRVNFNPSWSPKPSVTLLLNMRASYGVSEVSVWYDLVIQVEWAKVRSDRLVLDDIIYVTFYPYTSSGSKYFWLHFSEKTEW